MTEVHHVPAMPEDVMMIFRCTVGSKVLGVGTGDDDRDEMAVGVEGPRRLFGTEEPFEHWIWRSQPEGVRSGKGDLDFTMYSARKWARLAAAGNPTVLLPLFVPAVDFVYEGWNGYSEFHKARNHADKFVSRLTADRFLGYMQSQRQQMLGLRGKKHTNRPELVEKHGYDTKFAYHMIRLGWQGIELLETGKMTLPLPEWLRRELLAIRAGQRPMAEVVSWAESLEARLLELKQSSGLPPEPDRKWISHWLWQTYEGAWARGGTWSQAHIGLMPSGD